MDDETTSAPVTAAALDETPGAPVTAAGAVAPTGRTWAEAAASVANPRRTTL